MSLTDIMIISSYRNDQTVITVLHINNNHLSCHINKYVLIWRYFNTKTP